MKAELPVWEEKWPPFLFPSAITPFFLNETYTYEQFDISVYGQNSNEYFSSQNKNLTPMKGSQEAKENRAGQPLKRGFVLSEKKNI